ncbi:MAG: zf-TFIIB domain-containing protein [Gemmatimonadaceae bacterium]|nr:zf-TFIIB domain-containing protein [Gemmatimonadaceae bacterium]
MAIEEKPSRNEDEYFVKQDAELIRARRLRLDAERAAGERAQHFMKCPKCGGNLKEREYHSVKIDTCEDCKGVWLDAGELDMLARVERKGFSRVIGDILGLKE